MFRIQRIGPWVTSPRPGSTYLTEGKSARIIAARAERRSMPMALLILGTAGLFSLRSALKEPNKVPKFLQAAVSKSRVPKMMGTLILGMQAGQLAHHSDPVTIVTAFSAAFAAAIATAMAKRSGAARKYNLL